MAKYRIRYEGYAIVEADSPAEAVEQFNNDNTLYETWVAQDPEQIYNYDFGG